VLGPAGIAAQLAVLPKETVVGAVGGVSDKNLAAYWAAGVRAFGLGSSLYRPGMTATEVRTTALASVQAFDSLG
jgi:2-dehydro-3-deoxyphosphogalactonate aldolase